MYSLDHFSVNMSIVNLPARILIENHPQSVPAVIDIYSVTMASNDQVLVSNDQMIKELWRWPISTGSNTVYASKHP